MPRAPFKSLREDYKGVFRIRAVYKRWIIYCCQQVTPCSLLQLIHAANYTYLQPVVLFPP